MGDIIELHERLKAAEEKIEALIALGIELGHIKQKKEQNDTLTEVAR
jgi:hypothetical protein